MCSDEMLFEVMYCELQEEIGLVFEYVEVIGVMCGWLCYWLLYCYVCYYQCFICIGQKQVWFLLWLVGGEDVLKFDVCEKFEFDLWCWVDFWYLVVYVVNFKCQVYEWVLCQFVLLVEGLFSLQVGVLLLLCEYGGFKGCEVV